jgi:6-phosphogluconate dehydrogenase (decarboxylating)
MLVLDKMGSSIALRALCMKMSLVGFDKAGVPIELVQAGLTDVRSLGQLRETVQDPRINMLYVPATSTQADRVQGTSSSSPTTV